MNGRTYRTVIPVVALLVTVYMWQQVSSTADAKDEGSSSVSDTQVEHKWVTDFEQARKLSEEKGLPILADFSGSDWCGWCQKLDREVFSKKEFQEFAGKNFVLFLADYPLRKKQSKALATQNKALMKKYNVQGFPTVLLLDHAGKVLARTGYQRGGAAAYVKHLKELLPQRET